MQSLAFGWSSFHEERSHGNPYGPDSFPPQEVLRRMLLAMTYGARPSMALAQPATLQDATYASLHEIARREPWITHVQPEPWAALLLSDTTRVFYGRESGRVEERYLANVLGAFRTGVEEHLPVTVINEWDLNADDLSRYKVLILPNTACLSAAQAQTIREFVQKGGGLVATLDTSLCDEMGEPRKDFALADVFGVHYRGIPQGEGGKRDALDVNFLKGLDASYWEKRKNIYDFRMAVNTQKEPQGADPRLRAYIGEEPVTFKGQAVAVGDISADARTIGMFGVRTAPGTSLPAIVTQLRQGS
jgi:beta-galactosidase GanA